MISILRHVSRSYGHGLAFPPWWLRTAVTDESIPTDARTEHVVAIEECFGHALRTRRHRVLRLANAIEPDRDRMMSWLLNEGIAELDNLTADELLRTGRGDALESYLQAIVSGWRG